jgi:hypothetical protein
MDSNPVGMMQCYLNYLQWRLGDNARSLPPNSAARSIEVAEMEFDRAMRRFAGKAKPGMVMAPKKAPVYKKAVVAPTPPPKKMTSIPPTPFPVAGKKRRLRQFRDEEAMEVSHREAQAEDDANTSESAGSLRNFVADDDEQDAQADVYSDE